MERAGPWLAIPWDPAVIYHVFANRKNIGDWLCARAIQGLLDQPVVELMCDEPFVADTLARLSAAGPEDLVLIGGGGLLMDYFQPFWVGFEPLSRRLPFCLWGVGCCDMKRVDSAVDADLIARIVRRSRLCVVRDQLTRESLRGCDIPEPVRCPSITAVTARPLGHGVLHVDCLDNVGEPVYETMNAVASGFAADTGRPFQRINNRIKKADEQALMAMLDDYAQADVILTGRLHGCIIGLAMGRRVLAVSGDWKIESFMRAAGLQDWVLGLPEAHLIAGRLRALDRQRTPVAFLEAAREANRAVAQTVRDLAGAPRTATRRA